VKFSLTYLGSQTFIHTQYAQTDFIIVYVILKMPKE